MFTYSLSKQIWSAKNNFTGTIPTEFGNNVIEGDKRLGERSCCSSWHLFFVRFSWWNLVTDHALKFPLHLDTLCFASDFSNNDLTGLVPLELFDKQKFSELDDKTKYRPLSIYGNEFLDLQPVDGSVICNIDSEAEQLLGNRRKGDHYCDCEYDCFSPHPELPRANTCTCPEAQACCQSFLSQYNECTICEFGLANPLFHINEYHMSCRMLEYYTNLARQDYSLEKDCSIRRTDLISKGCTCKEAAATMDLTEPTEEPSMAN